MSLENINRKISGSQLENHPQNSLIEILYPEKLNDLNGTFINTIFCREVFTNIFQFKYPSLSPQLYFAGRFTFFLHIIEEQMNAIVKLITIAKTNDVRLNSSIWRKELQYLTYNKKIDFSLVEVPNGFYEPKFYAYFKRQLCFVVDFPSAVPIYEQILFRPFDNKIWIFLGITILICGFVWRFYGSLGNYSNTLNFMFAIFGFFVGQAVNIKR